MTVDLPDDLAGDDYLPNELSEGLCVTPQVVEENAADELNFKEIFAGLGRSLQQGVAFLKENAQDFTDPVLVLNGKDDGLV